MPEKEIEQRLLEHYGIRVDAEMSRYVARQLQHAGRTPREVAVIGVAAKTGAPLRVMIELSAMRATLQQAATLRPAALRQGAT